ncbi:MAG: TonB-dependent receptor [Brevundimonas sp.]|jgi:iron complex outermembrane receptor protein|uniref:TonB-dependent receptor n=1 Tax=Brevundimonas sp. TaxID=1871086 RepID=UPI0025BE7C77|nr:TonB-dependent receptor [Brevundimonas sp.]MCH4269405.1 TonB-dependent receptor [Brevundimonas sp.]
MKFSRWLYCGAALAAIGASPVMAQETAGSEGPAAAVEDIVVTAQRREQRLQDVPLAVSAFSMESLEDGKVESLLNLDGKVPNVVLAPVGAYPFASAFYIRGLGYADVESSFEPSVGVELDGVYLSRNVGAVQDFFDIGGVTILRGPQGTLYGRNTIGGVVSVQSRRPSFDFGARAQATFGSNGRQELRAGVEGALIEDKLAGKFSFLTKTYDGYIKNYDGRDMGAQDVTSMRGALLWTPTASFDATLIVDYTKDKGTGTAFENASLPSMVLPGFGEPADTDGDPFLSHVGDDIFSDLEALGVTLNANWDLGPVKLTSITGYRKTDTEVLSDFDGTPTPFMTVHRDETHDQFSQELRLASNTDGPLTYVVGAYYMTQEYDIATGQFGTVFGSPTAGSTIYTQQKADSWAVFGQADYEVLPGLTVTAGGRYSKEEKTFTTQPLFYPNAETFEASFDDFSPKVGVSYKWSDTLMTYAQYSRGFRAGGFNGRAGSFLAVGPYDSETVDSYEVGVKSDLFDRRLRLNAAVFTSDYQDMQQSVQQLIPGTLINQTLVANVGAATISGFEAEATALLTDVFTISASVGYLDASYDEFMADLGDGLGVIDRTYLPMPYAPKWSNSVTFNYKDDFDFGRVTAQASVRHMTDMYTSFSTLNATTDLTMRQSNTVVDGSVSLELPDGRWRVSLWGKNLTDELVINNTFGVGNLLASRVYQPPREIGVDLSLTF